MKREFQRGVTSPKNRNYTPNWILYILVVIAVALVTIAILSLLGPQIGNVITAGGPAL